MSDKEKKAWARRNDAAHGKERIQGDHEALMKDVKLLINILHRIIISITSASSQYIDCYTPGYPIRQLRESVEARELGFILRDKLKNLLSTPKRGNQ